MKGEKPTLHPVGSGCWGILETDRTLAEIAYQCGYADEAHMCRLFRRELALTPSDYRKKILAAPERKSAI